MSSVSHEPALATQFMIGGMDSEEIIGLLIFGVFAGVAVYVVAVFVM
jgi:hypothetical protein